MAPDRAIRVAPQNRNRHSRCARHRAYCGAAHLATARMTATVRLAPHQVGAIRAAVADLFGAEATVWLFGSRTDAQQRGGDIDLYIEHPATPPRRCKVPAVCTPACSASLASSASTSSRAARTCRKNPSTALRAPPESRCDHSRTDPGSCAPDATAGAGRARGTPPAGRAHAPVRPAPGGNLRASGTLSVWLALWAITQKTLFILVVRALGRNAMARV